MQDVVSNLKTDERIVFFNTDARLSEDAKSWILPVHAWVYEYERAWGRTGAISTALRVGYSLKTTDKTAANFKRRSRLIAADNERGKRLVIDFGEYQFVLPETQPNGHATAEFRLPREAAEKYVRGDQLTFVAKLPSGDDRVFSGTIRLIHPEGISIISDFDDTVKITHAFDRARMLQSTLYDDYCPVPGMAEAYRVWAKEGATIHFVSSSPWHLYEPIQEFLNHNDFPSRTMSLKSFRFKDSSLLNLFRKGTDTKPQQILPCLRAWPRRRFVLIGDSGQHDPDVYAEVARKFPEQVSKIYIRNVPGKQADIDRFKTVFQGVPEERWQIFDSADELTLPE